MRQLKKKLVQYTIGVILTLLCLGSPLHAGTILLTDFEDASMPISSYTSNGGYVGANYITYLVHEGSRALQVDINTNSYAGALIQLSGEQADWSEAYALSMWVYANNNNQTFNVIVEDAGLEQFAYTVTANWQGWKQVVIPLSGFSQTAYQPGSAVKTGTIDSPINTLHFFATSESKVLTLFFDRFELMTTENLKVLADFEDNSDSMPSYVDPGNSDVLTSYVSYPVLDGVRAMRARNYVSEYGGSVLPLSDYTADWAGAVALVMGVYGDNSGQTFDVIVEDSGLEQFSYQVTLNWQGWRQVGIPMGSFASRTWQPDGAVVNGVMDSPMNSLHFCAMSEGKRLTATFDQIALDMGSTSFTPPPSVPIPTPTATATPGATATPNSTPALTESTTLECVRNGATLIWTCSEISSTSSSSISSTSRSMSVDYSPSPTPDTETLAVAAKSSSNETRSADKSPSAVPEPATAFLLLTGLLLGLFGLLRKRFHR